MTPPPSNVGELVGRMDALLAPLEEGVDANRFFLATYRRATIVVGEEIHHGGFNDAEWVERWDVAFANLYLDALDQWTSDQGAPGPWAAAFRAARDERLPPLRQVLLGLNAPHQLRPAPGAAHGHHRRGGRRRGAGGPAVAGPRPIDAVLASRVDAEDKELIKVEQPGDRTWLDRAMTPVQPGRHQAVPQGRRAAGRGSTPACSPPPGGEALRR